MEWRNDTGQLGVRSMEKSLGKSFVLVNYVILCCPLSFFGIITNTITMVVYLKHDMNTVTISVLGLTVSDICSLLAMLLISLFYNPLFLRYAVDTDPREFLHLTASWPRGCFSNITRIITAYIAGERCLCVIAPFKVKQILTPRRTAAAVSLVYIMAVVSLIPEYSTHYLAWTFSPAANRTVLSLHLTDTQPSAQGITALLMGIMGLTSFALAIIFTYVTILQLRLQSRWRAQTLWKDGKNTFASVRDHEAIRMVVVLACVLICLHSLAITLGISDFAKPSVKITFNKPGIYDILWSLASLLQAVNSSIGIFLYYRMSSKFRRSFREIFYSRRKAAVT